MLFYFFDGGKISSVNFTNVLCAAFTLVDPESVKKIDKLTVFFTLLGSECVIAVRRTLMKLSPDLVTCMKSFVDELLDFHSFCKAIKGFRVKHQKVGGKTIFMTSLRDSPCALVSIS